MPKLLKELLQGKWLGHPLHPALAHVPAALFPAAMIFDLIAWSLRDANNLAVSQALAVTSAWCIGIGLLSVLLAAPTGLADWMEIKREKPAWKLGLIHAGLNVLVALIFLLNLILRLRDDDRATVGPFPLVLSIVGTAVLAYSGWLGGRLVYEYGIAVARMSKGEWREVAAAGGANVPEQQEHQQKQGGE